MPAGRPKGSRNADKRALRLLLQERYPDWEPALQMAAWANDETLDQPARFQACREVLDRLVPKLKAVEHSGAINLGSTATEALKALNDAGGN